jgi:putative addiction module killer protein
MQLIETKFFKDWMSRLRDNKTKMIIYNRLVRLKVGLAGDVKPVGEGVSELRIQYGAGYRVYYKQHNNEIIIILIAGDKSSQSKDIELAKEIARNIEG